MVTITCKHCELTAEPVKSDKEMVCSGCKEPFGYFQKTEYNNKINKLRVDKERAEANKKLTRGLKK